MDPHAMLTDTDRKLLLGFLLTAAIVLVLGAIILAEPARLVKTEARFIQGAVERGGELFAAHCTSCHGPEGRGDGETPAPALNNRAFLEKAADADIQETITYGRPGTQMRAFSLQRGGALGDQQIQDLVAFIRHWEATAEVLPTPTPQVDAEVLYGTRCVQCHGLTGEGRDVLPLALRSHAYLDTATAEAMRAQIREGKPAIGMPACAPDLSDAQVEALIALMEGWRDTLPEGGAEAPARAPDPFRGADLFARHCASCHGELGSGGTIVERAINSAEVLERTTPEGLQGLLETGIPGRAMPSFQDTLSDQDIRDLLALFQKWKWALLFR